MTRVLLLTATLALSSSLAACSGAVVPEASGSTTGSGGSSTSTGSSPTVCSPETCGPHAYCAYADFSCGLSDDPGACTPIPTSCTTAQNDPVCGCDGKTYPSSCAAAHAGVDTKSTGPCPGAFTCGPLICDSTSEYCSYAPDLQAPPTQSPYSCQPLPATCFTTPSCDCLSSVCGACAGTGATGLTKTCPGLG